MKHLALQELEAEANKHLDATIADYVAGGADDEWTVRANRSAYRRLALVPRVLTGAGRADLGTELFGDKVSMPVFLSPTAFHKLVHEEGECATARAAKKAGVLMIASMASTVALPKVAAVAGSTWFQLYLQPDLGWTEELVRLAENAGCTALVITVDSPVFGRRARDDRNGFHDLPAGMQCENLRRAGSEGGVRSIKFSPDLSWKDLRWLRGRTDLKIVLKGLAHPADVQIAMDCGADGILVSNHGGRQLDTMPSTLEMLGPIVEAAGSSVPVFVDGGIRRGTDVVKALALGARAVGIGRPVMWGLAVGGEGGVLHVLETLRTETEHALALTGFRTPGQLTKEVLRWQRTEEPWC